MPDDPPDPMSEAETRRTLLREAMRPRPANTPSSLEATLARISAEITADAQDRKK